MENGKLFFTLIDVFNYFGVLDHNIYKERKNGIFLLLAYLFSLPLIVRRV